MLQSTGLPRGRRHRISAAAAIALAMAGLSAGCNLLNPGTTTSPSTSSTEIFAGTLSAQGSSNYTFTVTQAGTVSVTLTSLSPTATAAVGLGIGTPSGTTTCTMTSTNPTAVAGSTPQITVSENPGKYCVEIFDVGNLTGTANFSIAIAHS